MSHPLCSGTAGPLLQPTHEEALLAMRLADRLHTMRTIAFVALTKQHGKAARPTTSSPRWPARQAWTT